MEKNKEKKGHNQFLRKPLCPLLPVPGTVAIIMVDGEMKSKEEAVPKCLCVKKQRREDLPAACIYNNVLHIEVYRTAATQSQ